MGVATTLSTAGREALEEAERASSAFDLAELARRTTALEAVAEGVPVSVVADRIGVTRPTIYRWKADAGADAEAAQEPEAELDLSYADLL